MEGNVIVKRVKEIEEEEDNREMGIWRLSIFWELGEEVNSVEEDMNQLQEIYPVLVKVIVNFPRIIWTK